MHGLLSFLLHTAHILWMRILSGGQKGDVFFFPVTQNQACFSGDVAISFFLGGPYCFFLFLRSMYSRRRVGVAQ